MFRIISESSAKLRSASAGMLADIYMPSFLLSPAATAVVAAATV